MTEIHREDLNSATNYGADGEECYILRLDPHRDQFLVGTYNPPWHPPYSKPCIDLALGGRDENGQVKLVPSGMGTPLFALTPEEAIDLGEKLIQIARRLIDDPLPVVDP